MDIKKATERQKQRKASRMLRHIERAPWDKETRDAFERLFPTLSMPPLSISPAEQRALDGTTLTKQKRAA